ncbi:MAG: hypothetical protein ACTSP4_02045 [Candidatus Hodarchaeales archaeon]
MMNFKLLEVAFDTLMFFSSMIALVISIVLMISVIFLDPRISIHIITETIVLAFFGAWGLIEWYREVM